MGGWVGGQGEGTDVANSSSQLVATRQAFE